MSLIWSLLVLKGRKGLACSVRKGASHFAQGQLVLWHSAFPLAVRKDTSPSPLVPWEPRPAPSLVSAPAVQDMLTGFQLPLPSFLRAPLALLLTPLQEIFCQLPQPCKPLSHDPLSAAADGRQGHSCICLFLLP